MWPESQDWALNKKEFPVFREPWGGDSFSHGELDAALCSGTASEHCLSLGKKNRRKQKVWANVS